MYAIFLNSNKRDNHCGFLAGLTVHRSKEYNNVYDGKQRIEPRLTFDESKIKYWKTKNATIKKAGMLAKQIETIEYCKALTKPFIHSMVYRIAVMDMDDRKEVYIITPYSYSSMSYYEGNPVSADVT